MCEKCDLARKRAAELVDFMRAQSQERLSPLEAAAWLRPLLAVVTSLVSTCNGWSPSSAVDQARAAQLRLEIEEAIERTIGRSAIPQPHRN